MECRTKFVYAILLLAGSDDLPAESCNGCTYERANDEDPEVGESLTTFEEGGTDAAGGIYARAGVVDANEVDEDQ